MCPFIPTYSEKWVGIAHLYHLKDRYYRFSLLIACTTHSAVSVLHRKCVFLALFPTL